MSRPFRLLKEGGWIVAGQVAAMVGALVLVRILTDRLDPTEYGRVALSLSVAGLVHQVVFGGLGAGIARYYSIAIEEDGVVDYLRVSLRLVAHATKFLIVAGSLLVVVLLWLARYEWAGLVLVVLLFSISNGYNAIISAVQNAARQRAVVAFHGGLSAWLRIVLAVGAVAWMGASGTVVVFGYAVGSLIVTASQCLFLRRLVRQTRITNHSSGRWANDIWLYSWPMMVGGLFNWAYYSSQRWALEIFGSTEDVGRFYALTQIAYVPISVAGATFLSFLTPILFARVGAPGNYGRVSQVNGLVARFAVTGLVVTAIAAVGSHLMRGLIVTWFVAAPYRNIFAYMPWIILAAGLLQVSLTLSTIVTIQNRTKVFLPLSVFGNCAIALLNLYATGRWGLEGLIVSMVFGSVLHLSWMLRIIYKQSPRTLWQSIA